MHLESHLYAVGVGVLPGHVIQLAIVHAEACATIFLLDQDNWCGLRTGGGLCYAMLQHVVYVLAYCPLLVHWYSWCLLNERVVTSINVVLHDDCPSKVCRA